MAKRPSRFRSAVAAVLFAALTAPAMPAAAPLQHYAVYVDGVHAGSADAFYNGAHTMVAMEGIAGVLHLKLLREGSSRLLDLEGDAYAFAPGKTEVTLAGSLVMQTVGPPEERGKMLFVALEDLQALLSESFAAVPGRIDVASAQAALNVHTAPLTHPRVSSYVVKTEGAAGGGRAAGGARRAVGDATNALVLHASLADFGGTRSRDFSLTTDGTRLRGNLAISAFDNSAPGINGQIAVGTHDRFVQFGTAMNPLNGLLFNAPGGYGLASRQPETSLTIEHDSLGRTVYAMRRERESGATIAALIRAGGTLMPVFGERFSTDGILKVTRELWVGPQGAAASLGLATQGRLFGEAVLSQSIGTFPLTIGEAPQRANIGFRATDRFVVRAGVTSGFAMKASPYAGVSLAGPAGLSASLQIAGANRNGTLSYTGPRASFSGTMSASPDGSSWGVTGSVTRGHNVVDISAFRSGTNEDEVVRFHDARGIGPIVGLERIVGPGVRRIGPIFGLSVPVSRVTAFELTEHPSGSRRTLSVGITQRIAFEPRVHLRTLQFDHAAASYVYVDDHLVGRIDERSHQLSVAPGSHRLQVRTADESRASLPVMIDDKSTRVDAAMEPVVRIAGRVVQADADPAGRRTSLEHITVKLEPGDLSVETDADGAFAFPASPVFPGARVSIVKDSLPPGLELGDDAPAEAGPVRLTVTTRVKVHRKTF